MATVIEKGVRVVRESFWHQTNGYDQLLKQGTTVRSDHPLVKKFQKFFYPVNYVDLDWPEKK